MTETKRALIIYNSKNSWLESIRRFKRDGKEFENRARDAGDYYRKNGYHVYNINVNPTELKRKTAFQRRRRLFTQLKEFHNGNLKFDHILSFCHGGKYNLDRNMISMLNIGTFADLIKSVASPSCKIVLFSCWTGRNYDGFAVKLSILTLLDVIAHSTRGHTTRNPYITMHRNNKMPLWPHYGGIRSLKKRLAFDRKDPTSNYRPFEFVEEVFGGEVC